MEPREKIAIAFGHELDALFGAALAPDGPMAASPDSNATRTMAWCQSLPDAELSPRDWRALRNGLVLCLAWSPSFLGGERKVAAAMILAIDDALEDASE